jgi:hypothetical protein
VVVRGLEWEHHPCQVLHLRAEQSARTPIYHVDATTTATASLEVGDDWVFIRSDAAIRPTDGVLFQLELRPGGCVFARHETVVETALQAAGGHCLELQNVPPPDTLRIEAPRSGEFPEPTEFSVARARGFMWATRMRLFAEQPPPWKFAYEPRDAVEQRMADCMRLYASQTEDMAATLARPPLLLDEMELDPTSEWLFGGDERKRLSFCHTGDDHLRALYWARSSGGRHEDPVYFFRLSKHPRALLLYVNATTFFMLRPNRPELPPPDCQVPGVPEGWRVDRVRYSEADLQRIVKTLGQQPQVGATVMGADSPIPHRRVPCDHFRRLPALLPVAHDDPMDLDDDDDAHSL